MDGICTECMDAGFGHESLGICMVVNCWCNLEFQSLPSQQAVSEIQRNNNISPLNYYITARISKLIQRTESNEICHNIVRMLCNKSNS